MNSKIKILEFVNKEYDGPKGRIIFMASMGGLSFGLLVYTINQAAEIAADISRDADIRLILIYVAICAITLVSKSYILNQTVRLTEEIVRKVRLRLIDKLRHTELQFLETTEKGEIYARIAQDTQLISQSSPTLVNSFDTFFSTIAVFIYILYLSVTAFMLTLASVGAMYVIFLSSYAKIKKELIVARMKEADFLDALGDTLSGFKEIKINSEKNNALFADIEALSRSSEQIKTDAELRYDKTLVLYIVLHQMVLLVIVFVVPLFLDTYGNIIIKLITAVLFLMGTIGATFAGVFSMLRANVAVENLERLEAKLDASGTIDAAASDTPGNFRTIALHSLSFRYSDKEDETLFAFGPVDLSIRQGEVVFIVGGNGSGKSTLLKLMTGLYYPLAGGRIMMDNRMVTRDNYQAYRELFSIIFTDFHLFKKLYGLESVDEKQVNHLLEKMDISTKTGYVDGRFTNLDLSTGQKKRLAYIAALLEDKPVYIFDEWAADQDPVFRKHFYERFLEDLRTMKKTVIAVTHDDKYFYKADRVIKMEEGKMAEEVIT